MPLFEYKCPGCGVEESRIAGLDDRTVVCTSCSQLMRRLNEEEDLFQSYWNKEEHSSKSTSLA